MERNVFLELFEYHSRKSMTPEENYLTQAFSYVLRAHPSIAKKWLATITGTPVDTLTGRVRVKTQQYYRTDGGQPAFVDMVVRCGQASGEQLVVLFEHKWHSRVDIAQLERYRGIRLPRAQRRLICITDRPSDQRIAAGHCDQALLWEDVYTWLDKQASHPRLVRDFAAFLEEHNLGRKPFTPSLLKKPSRELTRTCDGIARRLAELPWTAIPPRLRPKDKRRVRTEHGRTGISFTPGWKPHLFVGFQQHTPDLGFALSDPRKGLDLMLAIGVEPRSTNIASAALDRRLAELRRQGAVVLGPEERRGK